MPKSNDGGWFLDDTPLVSDEESREIFRLIEEGKNAEAQALMDRLFAPESDDR
jgi:hypothetical protein